MSGSPPQYAIWFDEWMGVYDDEDGDGWRCSFWVTPTHAEAKRFLTQLLTERDGMWSYCPSREGTLKALSELEDGCNFSREFGGRRHHHHFGIQIALPVPRLKTRLPAAADRVKQAAPQSRL
jgi:hypothetical protein